MAHPEQTVEDGLPQLWIQHTQPELRGGGTVTKMKYLMVLLVALMLSVSVSYAILKEKEVQFKGYITQGSFEVFSDAECTQLLEGFTFDAFNTQDQTHVQSIDFYIKSTGDAAQEIYWRSLTDGWLIQDSSYYYSTDGNWEAKLWADYNTDLFRPYYETITLEPNATIGLTFSLTANIQSEGECTFGVILSSELA